MPDIVTFDPTLKHIVEIDTGGDNELDVKEIYSEWKVWSQQNPKWLPAMSVIGGDPLTPELDLGSTFFLENGWRFRPAERNHRVTLVGNLWTREPGEDPSVDTLAPYRVTVQQRVSNLVDASVARLDLDQLLQAVYVDLHDGVAGTGEGVGTPTNPSNNIADAFIIAASKNLHEFRLRGHLYLDRNISDWTFTGIGNRGNAGVHIEGYSVDGCLFDNTHVDGWMTGATDIRKCDIRIIDGLEGRLHGCGLVSSFQISENASVHFVDCHAESGNGYPSCIFRQNSVVQFRNYSGNLELFGMTAGCIAVVDLDPGALRIHSSCTGGTVLVRGVGTLEDNSNGLVSVEKTGLVGPSLTDAETRAVVREETWDVPVNSVVVAGSTGSTLKDIAANTEATIAKVNTL